METALKELVSAAMFYRASVQQNFGKPSNEAINVLSMALHYASIMLNERK